MIDFFNNKAKLELLAPLTGTIVKLSEVPDQIFSAKTIGEGIAIKPSENILVAPIKGVIEQLFSTKHALRIKTELGVEILIHLGINTVKLKGKGFENIAEQGDRINPGDKLIKFDADYMSDDEISMVTPIILINREKIDDFEVTDTKKVIAGKDKILRFSLQNSS